MQTKARYCAECFDVLTGGSTGLADTQKQQLSRHRRVRGDSFLNNLIILE